MQTDTNGLGGPFPLSFICIYAKKHKRKRSGGDDGWKKRRPERGKM